MSLGHAVVNQKGEAKVTLPDLETLEENSYSVRDLLWKLLLEWRKTNLYLADLASIGHVSDDDVR